MGSPVSVMVANLYMEFFEDVALEQHRLGPGSGRSMLITSFASSERAQQKIRTPQQPEWDSSYIPWSWKKMGPFLSWTLWPEGGRMEV